MSLMINPRNLKPNVGVRMSHNLCHPLSHKMFDQPYIDIIIISIVEQTELMLLLML